MPVLWRSAQRRAPELRPLRKPLWMLWSQRVCEPSRGHCRMLSELTLTRHSLFPWRGWTVRKLRSLTAPRTRVKRKRFWKKDVRSATARILRLNAEDMTFVRAPISTLTREIERRGGISGRTWAAFYTDVLASLVAKVNVRCRERKLDVLKPEIELE